MRQLDQTDASDTLDHLLGDFSMELAVPNEQRLLLIQKYFSLLNSIFNPSETPRLPGRREGRFYSLFSMELLDLALQFNVPLDKVAANILRHQQVEPPRDPGMVITIFFHSFIGS